MNIFVLSLDPVEAARSQCNSHIVKMCLETAQLLVAAHPAGSTSYSLTHINHPCSKWTRESLANYRWLVLHGLAICEEYTRRYDKIHASQDIIVWCGKNTPDIPDVGLTPFARAIKEPWRTQTIDQDIVTAYRAYYVGDKARFAKWQPRACPPDWWTT